jgi:predicted DNA-binding transcriptional regulator AlpA
LTVQQVSNYLSIPASTLYTWRTRRPGFGPPALKIGGMLRYRKSDVDEWVREHEESFRRDVVTESRRGKDSPDRTPSISRRSGPRGPGKRD